MKFLNKVLLLAAPVFFVALPSYAFAAVDNFEVELSPTNTSAWEYLDFSIEAKDSNNQTVTDYTGMVLIFSESDPEAELPTVLEENTYTFKSSDQWKVMFENAVKFLNEWTQNIYVYDFNDDTIFWAGEVEVEWWSSEQSATIDIINPDSWITIWTETTKVSGSTTKNHKVEVTLNWEETFETTSNNDWIYEVDVEWLKEWENSIVSAILDSDDNVIWESEEVRIMYEWNSISLRNVSVTPEEVEVEWEFEIEVTANEWLRDVSVVINDVVTNLEEWDPWVYTVSSFAPGQEWTYSIDVILKDEIWNEERELWAASLTVNPAEQLNAAEDEEEEIPVEDEEEQEEVDLTIKNLKLVTLKTKSVLTWDEIDEALSYNVYRELDDSEEMELVENVEEPRFEIQITWDEVKYENFYVKAVTEDDNWEPYEWALSDATKVKTWPELLLLLLVALILPIVFFTIKQRRA